MTAIEAPASHWSSGWDRLIDGRADLRPLALLRVAAGFLVFFHLAPFRSLAAQGVAYSDIFYEPYVGWFPEASRSTYFLLLNLATLAAVLVSVGLGTRVATAYTAGFVGYNLFLSQTHFHHNRAFLFILLVALAVLPVGRMWSVDGWLRRRFGDRFTASTSASRWPLSLLRFELAAVYVASGASKLFDPDWWGGLVNQIRMEREAAAILDRGVPEWLLDIMLSSGFHAWTAKVVVLTELFIGIGLLVPRLRLVAIWVAIPFHVIIELTADVQIFSYAALAALVVWVTPVSRDRRVVIRGTGRLQEVLAWMIRWLDWTSRFTLSRESGAGPAVTLHDRPASDGAPITRHGLEALRMILTRLPATFWLTAPLLLPGLRGAFDRRIGSRLDVSNS